MTTATAVPPLILVTNDDGIASPGLWAAARAVSDLGEVLVVAPNRQWSGAGRSLPKTTGQARRYTTTGWDGVAYQIDGSPAAVVLHAIHRLVSRRPALLISGINFGENLGTDVTLSGTVGAALQGAVCGVPALAISLQTPKETHLNLSDEVDFTAAAYFTRLFARRLLRTPLPFDVDVLKVDVPDDATPETPWRLTRVSRAAYFVTVLPEGTERDRDGDLDYDRLPHPELTEPDSDIYALAVERVVTVAPLSVDLSSRGPLGELEELLFKQ